MTLRRKNCRRRRRRRRYQLASSSAPSSYRPRYPYNFTSIIIFYAIINGRAASTAVSRCRCDGLPEREMDRKRDNQIICGAAPATFMYVRTICTENAEKIPQKCSYSTCITATERLATRTQLASIEAADGSFWSSVNVDVDADETKFRLVWDSPALTGKEEGRSPR